MARAKSSATGAAVRSFTAVIEPDEADGGYVVTFPAIPDLATQGETLEEARRMAEDCLRGYLEVLRETGRPLPAQGAATPSGRATIVARRPSPTTSLKLQAAPTPPVTGRKDLA
jgi:predicted RNase H-like HicB family nuclease